MCLFVCCVCVCVFVCVSTPVCGCCVQGAGLGFRAELGLGPANSPRHIIDYISGLKPRGSGHVPAEEHAEEHEEPPDV